MIRGKAFYAVWDEAAGIWSTDEFDVARLVDEDLTKYYNDNRSRFNCHVDIRYMSNFSSNSWKEFKKYLQLAGDNWKQLDTKIIFSNTTIERKDYASIKLEYPLARGKHEAYDELMNTLYSMDERQKIEWAIGAIISGDSKTIQKFLVFYGDPGTGKSTVLDIIHDMFLGYSTTFEAKSLASANSAFATEAFKTNPLIAIQHDGDLSKIEDNSKLNSIISHEEILINEKYKSAYPMRVNCMLFMGTNKPVKITDGKAGIIRRLIDVRPTGNKVEASRYLELKEQIKYEYPAIAQHCLDLYLSMGKNYYNKYKPVEMMFKTDPFFNFVEYYYDEFRDKDMVPLKVAFDYYKRFCDETNYVSKMPMYIFREELKNYFNGFEERMFINGMAIRSVYTGFKHEKFEAPKNYVFEPVKAKTWIRLKDQPSLLDEVLKECPAQYGNAKETPASKWDYVKTVLADIDPRQLHYILVPENHIVIDFDLKDDTGKKSLEKNLEAASKFPKTYVETSKSGSGLHLHYIYDGDVSKLSRVYDDNIEIKVFTGNSSLRRKLVMCNDIPVATINTGLPLKEVKGDSMVNFESAMNDKMLKSMIIKNINKEYHPNTKPSIDYIYKLLEDAYNSGMHYDLRNLKQSVYLFAMQSSHQAEACLKMVSKMHFCSDDISAPAVDEEEKPIVFYDVEVFPNLFLVNWKKIGPGNPVVRMINPSPEEMEELMRMKLVGFNCRRYDNHMIYARYLGYTNEALYLLSQKIIKSNKGENRDAFFGEAYNLSYTDIYDYSTKKQSLKKWEIELGIHHMELDLPWDQPVPEERWVEVAEYCDNDVIATEAVWNATTADFLARQILVGICKHAGINACVNDTTNTLTTKIIFGNERHPQLVYTHLEETFPGYEYIPGSKEGPARNMYMGEDAGFGGYVWVKEGVYTNVALLDVASMHPHSILAMDCFGEYTQRFRDLVDARIAIKHKDWDKARTMLDGALAPYLEDESQAKSLSTALKIPINSVYGLTSAKFDNPFRHKDNKNNIVALRGALFMILLKNELLKRGYEPFHFKTDSVKIANATPEAIQFVMDFGQKYGYTFEHEATYSKICIVNGSTYIARYANIPEINGDHCGEWTATAAQFQQPYVFKTLFSHEKIEFKDLCETKEVKGSLYLDFNENLEDVELLEAELNERMKPNGKPKVRYSNLSTEEIEETVKANHSYKFVGRIGEFCPIKPGYGGAKLMRFADDKYSAATGAKDYRWLESEYVYQNGLIEAIDKSYYTKLVDEAVAAIAQYDDFEWFVSDDDVALSPVE